MGTVRSIAGKRERGQCVCVCVKKLLAVGICRHSSLVLSLPSREGVGGCVHEYSTPPHYTYQRVPRKSARLKKKRQMGQSKTSRASSADVRRDRAGLVLPCRYVGRGPLASTQGTASPSNHDDGRDGNCHRVLTCAGRFHRPVSRGQGAVPVCRQSFVSL